MVRKPTFHHERALIEKGFTAIVGVDEVGYGALAGPVVAGAVILPLNSRLGLIRDSKTLTEKQRNKLYGQIAQKADAWSVGMASPEEINELNVRGATYLAMRRAVEKIKTVEFALVDAWQIPGLPHPQRGVKNGDRDVKSIAAASIMAKVTRDRLMVEYAKDFPQYGFDRHKGYGTKAHRNAIDAHGPCPIHRTSYACF